MRPILVLVFAISSAPCAFADEKPVEMPLKEVWSTDMPGTRKIRELEPRTQGDNREFGPLMHGIYGTMQGGRSGRAWGRPDAGPGFPVPGTGIAALHRVYDVIVDNPGERPDTVPNGEVSIVFFARGGPGDCYLEKIEREGAVITLTYRLHARREGGITSHLALIPSSTPRHSPLGCRVRV